VVPTKFGVVHQKFGVVPQTSQSLHGFRTVPQHLVWLCWRCFPKRKAILGYGEVWLAKPVGRQRLAKVVVDVLLKRGGVAFIRGSLIEPYE
jgi:hypothetical protein